MLSCNIIVHDIGGLSSYIYVALAERSECGSGRLLADENLCHSFSLLRELLGCHSTDPVSLNGIHYLYAIQRIQIVLGLLFYFLSHVVHRCANYASHCLSDCYPSLAWL